MPRRDELASHLNRLMLHGHDSRGHLMGESVSWHRRRSEHANAIAVSFRQRPAETADAKPNPQFLELLARARRAVDDLSKQPPRFSSCVQAENGVAAERTAALCEGVDGGGPPAAGARLPDQCCEACDVER